MARESSARRNARIALTHDAQRIDTLKRPTEGEQPGATEQQRRYMVLAPNGSLLAIIPAASEWEAGRKAAKWLAEHDRKRGFVREVRNY